ncbi:DUF3658 domain-containing protein [Paraburkholderia kururiensis]|uniref:DUF3658 domain-containing protein n=1 Tax=Paraburkholderia kururiensis TaxID=984307 RepID=UPI002279DA05|nr:DUF3658 domain-containing protein [Paraburkholderia kururiensis]
MQPNIQHICQGGSAMELVSTVVGDNVTGIRDDCAVGPLIDVDSPAPEERIAFWNDIFAADKNMSQFDWQAEFLATCNQLRNLGREAAEVVIWAGSHPTEQALRRRVHWWLRSTPVKVSEVLVDIEDMADGTADRIHAPIACASVERLRLRFSHRLESTDYLRKQLADEWGALRDHGQGVRLWEGDRLLEYPIDHYDATLLALVEQQPVRFARVVGHAMAETGQSDCFCKWRFATLVRTGHLSLASGNFHDWLSAMICRDMLNH